VEIDSVARPLESRFDVRWSPQGETILEVVHLIERPEAPTYRQRLESTSVEVTGPRPPYHFLPQFLRVPVKAERRAGRGGRGRSAAAG
jgi:hypothetical protein